MKEKQSIKVHVYKTLREAILSRKLPPGKQIIENVISSKLNVSRTPIRSAIIQLATEGLVEIVPNKGAFVINPTLDEILQAYDLRKELEIMAVELSLNHLKESNLKEMEKIIKKEKEALYKKDMENYVKANQHFHMALASQCGNKFLIEFIDKLINQTSIYLILFDVFFEEQSPQPYGYKEHLEIIDLIRQNDRKKVKNALAKHFDNAIKSLNIKSDYSDLDRIFE
ncbi:MAG TPA: GntR family transcriptional regulator [Bacillus sp. (in: firmicutes)]|uniref:GntR family transcriptional regulator n=1 Tax=Bacillus litorisediminis TaxID=2922713 RepID=UPI001FAB841B|nr:GntR family transcriptional regulator [Bacillus litorisediminis]HWO78673.1 GntR family transcriptional regulator [Bacillus sp. (in: firmicutes)]